MIRTAFKTSLPILFGFVPLGIAFGLLFQELNKEMVSDEIKSLNDSKK